MSRKKPDSGFLNSVQPGRTDQLPQFGGGNKANVPVTPIAKHPNQSGKSGMPVVRRGRRSVGGID